MAAASTRRVTGTVRVIFLGPPGAGKGDKLRTAIAQETPLGREARPSMERGNLVSDELLLTLVRQRIERSDCSDGHRPMDDVFCDLVRAVEVRG